MEHGASINLSLQSLSLQAAVSFYILETSTQFFFSYFFVEIVVFLVETVPELVNCTSSFHPALLKTV